MMYDNEEFAQKLLDAGWSCPNDAQWENLAVLLDGHFEYVASLTTERDQLRAEVERQKKNFAEDERDLTEEIERAEKAEAEVERLEQNVCGDCLEYEDDGTPSTAYGWNENRVEGQIPCSCISESGPYQILLDRAEKAEAEVDRLRGLLHSTDAACGSLRGDNKALREDAEIVRLIKDLSQGEGDAVQICHPNPDDGPAHTIMVTKEFGDWTQYYGDSILDCLYQAVKGEG
jgi:hypothetical protein